MLTQMKRWGQIKGDVDYDGIAKQVYLATDTTKLMKESGADPAGQRLQIIRRDGQDVRSGGKPEDYLASFKIKKPT
jgi:nitrate/nitrite transport system substrate-binding protein